MHHHIAHIFIAPQTSSSSSVAMDPPPVPNRSSSALFDVFLRLRPGHLSTAASSRFLDVEPTEAHAHSTHITIKPPSSDHRKRAIEKFGFTRVFEEHSSQLDVFDGVGVIPLIEGVLGQPGHHGRDGLLATLGVTGSGKSHTILGTKTQRGLTQLALDVLFRSTGRQLLHHGEDITLIPTLAACDVSEAQMFSATSYFESLYGDAQSERGYASRAQTPMLDSSSFITFPKPNAAAARLPRPSALPQSPSVEDVKLPVDPKAEYAIIVYMYEVYNDRIYDLLAGQYTGGKPQPQRRRALLFKSTEHSPDRKVVAGLKKVVCSTLEEALMVLETGLLERKVAGTGSNAVSSRSHGFFCVEVKKRYSSRRPVWSSSTMTIVDLAGSERARNAKTAGATLAEAGKINESLMYLGQCMQMQSDNQDGSKNIVPFRQCKLTELLFSNSFPSNQASNHHRRNPQKGVMIVAADPCGDYNATSQILRYSALAREVTVPRIPSFTSTVLRNAPSCTSSTASGRSSPSQSQVDLEAAQIEMARLQEQIEILTLQMTEEKARRQAAEASWRASEERMQSMEVEVREECWNEMEERVTMERRRWETAWQEEQDRADERIDRKIEILERQVVNVPVYEDDITPSPQPNGHSRILVDTLKRTNDDLEKENELLRGKVERLERQEMTKSPTKKMRVLKAKRWEVPGEDGFGSP